MRSRITMALGYISQHAVVGKGTPYLTSEVPLLS